MVVLDKLFLFILIINVVHSYYFFNKETHHVINWPTLNDIPEGYRLINPPKTLRINKPNFVRGLYCQDIGFSCSEPYSMSQTYQFECETDSQCPNNYICCPQKCFNHKICIKGSLSPQKISNTAQNLVKASTRSPANQINTNEKNDGKPGTCKKWQDDCKYPRPYKETKQFKCDTDGQCPGNLKCCQYSCFTHKICYYVLNETVLEIRRKDDYTKATLDYSIEPAITSSTDSSSTKFDMKVEIEVNTEEEEENKSTSEDKETTEIYTTQYISKNTDEITEREITASTYDEERSSLDPNAIDSNHVDYDNDDNNEKDYDNIDNNDKDSDANEDDNNDEDKDKNYDDDSYDNNNNSE